MKVGVSMRKSYKKNLYHLLVLLDRGNSEHQCRNKLKLSRQDFNELLFYLDGQGLILGVIDASRLESQDMDVSTYDLRISPQGEEYLIQNRNNKVRYWITTFIAILALLIAVASLVMQLAR